MLFEPYVRFHSLTEWSPTMKKLLTRLTICFLSMSTLLTHLSFRSGNFFLIVPFPDHCLLVPFHKIKIMFKVYCHHPVGEQGPNRLMTVEYITLTVFIAYSY